MYIFYITFFSNFYYEIILEQIPIEQEISNFPHILFWTSRGQAISNFHCKFFGTSCRQLSKLPSRDLSWIMLNWTRYAWFTGINNTYVYAYIRIPVILGVCEFIFHDQVNKITFKNFNLSENVQINDLVIFKIMKKIYIYSKKIIVKGSAPSPPPRLPALLPSLRNKSEYYNIRTDDLKIVSKIWNLIW